MKKKYQRIKDKADFCNELAKLFSVNPENVYKNWFSKLFTSLPRGIKESEVDEFMDRYIEYEKEANDSKKKLHTKYFGK